MCGLGFLGVCVLGVWTKDWCVRVWSQGPGS